MSPYDWLRIADEYDEQARIISEKIEKRGLRVTLCERSALQLFEMRDECIANARAIRERMKKWT